MGSPQRYVNRMILFLLITGGIVGALYETVVVAFLFNPALNGLILGVLLIGVVFAFRRVLMLKPEVNWINAFQASQMGYMPPNPPRLISSVATALGDKPGEGVSPLSANSVRYLLDSILSRLEEGRDIARYLTGLLIFLGLLGTFWGLLNTINSVGSVISGLSIGDGDVTTVFENLKEGLAAPMGGMGTAFSSSLFGLSGSLLLGFIDLQANQAQNRFFNDLEEWLSGLTRLRDAPVPGDASSFVNTGNDSRSMDRLVQTLARFEKTTRESAQAQEHVLQQLSQSQNNLVNSLNQLSLSGAADFNHPNDPAGNDRMSHFAQQMSRQWEQSELARTQMINELRAEIRLVARTIAEQRR